MQREVDSQILAEFFEEIFGYFPAIHAALADLDAATAEQREEAYRFAHTIKGAAAIVGFGTLSHVAYYLEELVQSLHEGTRQPSPELQASLILIAQEVEIYSRELAKHGAGVDPRRYLEAIIPAAHRWQGLPPEQDPVVIERLLHEHAAAHVPAEDDRPSSRVGRSDASDRAATPDRRDAETDFDRDDSSLADDGFPLATHDSVRDSFFGEAEDNIQLIVRRLTRETSPFENPDCIREMQRAIHSIKGGAGMLGCRPIADLAHRMEDLLIGLLEGQLEASPTVAGLLMESLDYLEDMVTGWEDGRFDRAVAQLLERYALVAPAAAPGADPAAAKSAPPGSAAKGGAAPAETVVPQFDAGPEVPAELLAVYLEEAEDHLRKMQLLLPAIEADLENRSLMLDLRRIVHTLKGASGAVGFRAVAQLSHRMEDLLDRVYEGQVAATPQLAALLFDTTYLLDDLSRAGNAATAEPKLREVYAAYQAILGAPAEVYAPSQMEVDAEAELDESPCVLELPGVEIPSAPQTDTNGHGSRAKAAGPASPTARAGEMVRVPIERLDQLVKLVSELVVNRTAFEERMAQLERTTEEFRRSTTRLKQVSTSLESEYEVDALQRPVSAEGTWTADRTTSRLGLHAEFDELELDRYTGFHLLSRSLVETAGDISTVESEFQNLIGDFDALLVRQSRLSRDIQDRLMRMRMIPLASLATRLHRAVRVVANKEGKAVDLILEGEQIEFDKSVLDEMADPLFHLLRNAVGHGIEPSLLREANGKPPRGVVKVRAFYQGTQVAIEISDDGAGLAPEAIRSEAVRRGFLSESDAALLSENEVMQLIFLPGLSTANEISEVSGRGVGMDIVKSQVHKLKGSVSVTSTPNRGTTFLIRLPMTLAITQALLVKAYNQTYAIPIQAVLQIHRIERQKIDRVGQTPVVNVGGKVYRLVKLGELLGLKEPAGEETTKEVPVLFVDTGSEHIAMAVDRVLVGREIVVMTLGSHLRRVHRFMGATLLGDGAVVPILNPSELLEKAPERTLGATTTRTEGEAQVRTVMVVDDSVSVRRVSCNLLKNAGYVPLSAKDGLDAYEQLQTAEPSPDLILLDVEMPRMDGYEFLSMVRQESRFQQLPIVMVTSRAGDKHRNKAMSLGATEYVVKPFEDHRLLNLIQGLIRQAKAVGV